MRATTKSRLFLGPVFPRENPQAVRPCPPVGSFLLPVCECCIFRQGEKLLFQAARHLIEQPILGTWSVGATPVSATCRMASKSSRLPPSTGFLPEASSLPR